MTIRPSRPVRCAVRRRFAHAPAVLVVAGLLLGGCAGQASGPAVGWYGAHGGVAPAGERIYVCHAFGCARKTAFDFTPRRLATMKRILAAGAASPSVSLQVKQGSKRYVNYILRETGKKPVVD